MTRVVDKNAHKLTLRYGNFDAKSTNLDPGPPRLIAERYATNVAFIVNIFLSANM